jgi:hypothetical protein
LSVPLERAGGRGPPCPMPSLPGPQPGKVRLWTTKRRQPMPLRVPDTDFATRRRQGDDSAWLSSLERSSSAALLSGLQPLLAVVCLVRQRRRERQGEARSTSEGKEQGQPASRAAQTPQLLPSLALRASFAAALGGDWRGVSRSWSSGKTCFCFDRALRLRPGMQWEIPFRECEWRSRQQAQQPLCGQQMTQTSHSLDRSTALGKPEIG